MQDFVHQLYLGASSRGNDGANDPTGLQSQLGGCQNYGPFLGTLNIRCRIIIRTQKGTLILTTTQLCVEIQSRKPLSKQAVERQYPATVVAHRAVRQPRY